MNLDQTPDSPSIRHFLDCRFGLFIHWGVYSQLGGQWQGRDVGTDLGEWIMNGLKIPIAEYEKIAATFNPSAFDAEAIVRRAADAGMRYIVLTAKHHDGFAMFHSDSDRYNIVDWTGGTRDVCAELAAACRKHGLQLGFYYSQALDWHEEHAGGWNVKPYGIRSTWGNVWDFPDNTKKQFDLYFRKKVLPQVRELLTKYGDVFLIWFDTPRTINPDQSEELYQLVKSLQPDCLVNSRIGNERGDYSSLGDNQIPAVSMDRPTETPVTLNDTWGFKTDDANWKTSEEIVEMLCKVASRNVNLLLNIGPRGDGSLTPETEHILRGLADWHKTHGPAVHDTRGSPVPGAFNWGYLTIGKREIYLCLQNPKAQTLRLNGLLQRVSEVRRLGAGQAIPFRQEGQTLILEIPDLDGFLPVLCATCEGTPRFEDKLQPQNRTLSLPILAATFNDGTSRPAASVIMPRLYEELPPERKAHFESFGPLRISASGLLTGWTRAADRIEWPVVFTESGDYRIEILRRKYGYADKIPFGGEIRLELDPGDTRAIPLKEDDVFSESRSNREDNLRVLSRGGCIRLDTPGPRTVRLRLSRDVLENEAEIALTEIRFVRENDSQRG
ncbi:MAG: alpha-L-fucosidase [Kiritimatiellia bacterium]|nr:alpha-L-fucosidase [Kiritimatiellia bacterium]